LVAGSSWRGRVGRSASARGTGTRLARLIEIAIQPLPEMLADSTPVNATWQRRWARRKGTEMAHRKAIICRDPVVRGAVLVLDRAAFDAPVIETSSRGSVPRG